MNEYTSQDITKLAAAMIAVQSVLKPVEKEKNNPFFKSKYADLVAVIEACREILTKNEIAVIQTTIPQADKLYLRTMLLHISGQWIAGDYLLNPIKNDPQGLASSMTYARRYSLMAIIGLVAQDEDDDGNSASAHTKTESQQEKSSQSSSADNLLIAEFIPQAFTFKDGKKTNGETFTRYSVKNPNGEWMSTFDETLGRSLKRAYENQKEIKVTFAIEGQYKNIKDVEKLVAF